MCCFRWHPARVTELQKRYAEKGGMDAIVVRLRLPDGSLYDHDGKIDYIEPTVCRDDRHDHCCARGSPIRLGCRRPTANRSSGRWWTAPSSPFSVEGIQPVMALGIPRKSVLSDQQGDYVYVVGADNKVQQRRIQLGQSTPSTAIVAGGLKDGEMVVTEGIQRVRPGIEVSPGPATPLPADVHTTGRGKVVA